MNKIAEILKRFGFLIFLTLIAYFLSFDITGVYPPPAEYEIYMKWFVGGGLLYIMSALFEEE